MLLNERKNSVNFRGCMYVGLKKEVKEKKTEVSLTYKLEKCHFQDMSMALHGT